MMRLLLLKMQRHITEGQNKVDAALQGARELVGPVIATTAVLVAVYLPVGLQGGLTGHYLKSLLLHSLAQLLFPVLSP